jgi:hypothetical protein
VKRNQCHVGITLLFLIAAGAQGASAQSAQVIRGDAAGTIGWLAADTHSHSAGPYERNNWFDSFFSSVSTGWHWTDNLKTEVDFGVGTESREFHTQPVTIAGRSTYQTIESRFKRRTIGFSQQYQFLHNVWFHPHVAAGLNVTWERRRDDPSVIYLYDPGTGTSRYEPPKPGTEQKSWTANPFVAIGYKAYMSDRVFFRNDFRLAFRGGIDETTLRIGLGFDF